MSLIRAKDLFYLVPILLLWACGPQESSKKDRLSVLATTGLLEDAVKNITGDHAEVSALMGPGVDPHLYKATDRDRRSIMNADIVFYNGLHLEGKIHDILQKLSERQTVVAGTDGIEKSKLRSFSSSHDPHVWFDVRLWMDVVKHLSENLAKADTINAATYQQNTAQYLKELEELDNWTREQILTIPEQQRVLITAHDAFGYFGDAYGIEVKGLQGISTIADMSLFDLSQTVDLIVNRKIKAVFIESSVPQRTVDAVVSGARSKGHAVSIGGTLYSDAMGESGTPEGTYIGMVRHNVKTIVSALR